MSLRFATFPNDASELARKKTGNKDDNCGPRTHIHGHTYTSNPLK